MSTIPQSELELIVVNYIYSHEIVFIIELFDGRKVSMLRWLAGIGESILEPFSFQPQTIFSFVADSLLVLAALAIDLFDPLQDLSFGRLHQRSVDILVFGLLGLQFVDVALHCSDRLLAKAKVVKFK